MQMEDEDGNFDAQLILSNLDQWNNTASPTFESVNGLEMGISGFDCSHHAER